MASDSPLTHIREYNLWLQAIGGFFFFYINFPAIGMEKQYRKKSRGAD